MSLHCNLDLEDSKPSLTHDALAQSDAPPYQVGFTNGSTARTNINRQSEARPWLEHSSLVTRHSVNDDVPSKTLQTLLVPAFWKMLQTQNVKTGKEKKKKEQKIRKGEDWEERSALPRTEARQEDRASRNRHTKSFLYSVYHQTKSGCKRISRSEIL